MTTFFQFEADFVDSLQCIPMQVRMKLDTCGIKLKLNQWNRFNQEERQQLVSMSCSSDPEIQTYREFLQNLVTTKIGETAKELVIDPHPDWLNEMIIPSEIQEQAASLGVKINLEQWQKLTSLQRFALIKLSQSKHENSNFLPALKEFDLV
ncbi:MAG TPA: nitrate reductase associated protein [Allocoleopsis sp.]